MGKNTVDVKQWFDKCYVTIRHNIELQGTVMLETIANSRNLIG